MRAWVPSQKGFVPEPPQRQSRAVSARKTVRPVPEQISSGPET